MPHWTQPQNPTDRKAAVPWDHLDLQQDKHALIHAI